MTPPTLLLCCTILYVTSVRANACTTFFINGSYINSFNYYRFYDFRGLESTNIVGNDLVHWDPEAQSLLVNNSSWSRHWEIKEQAKAATGKGTFPWNYTASNVKIGKFITHALYRCGDS